jgi:hypothetical protein
MVPSHSFLAELLLCRGVHQLRCLIKGNVHVVSVSIVDDFKGLAAKDSACRFPHPFKGNDEIDRCHPGLKGKKKGIGLSLSP